jgi:eukaryotic-like serine/threonine-protein kinase
VLWPVIRGLLDHVPSRRLGPDEAERMLRQVAESGGGSGTAILPALAPGPATTAGAGRTHPGSGLESAEHTLTLRPWEGALPTGPDLVPVPDLPDAGALPDEPDPGALPDQPDPHALPDEPDPGALPDQPDPHPLPDEPDPGVPPDHPDLHPLPDEPELPALADQPDLVADEPRSVVEPEAVPPPDEPEPAVLAEIRSTAPPEPAPEAGATAPALIPGLGGRYRPAEETRETRTRPRRTPLAWVVAAAATFVVVAVVVIGLLVTSHHRALATPNPGHSAAHGASPSSARPTPSAKSAAPTNPPPSSPAATSSPGSGSGALGPAVIPDGFTKFVNSTGFSIAVPDGWRVSHQGHYVYLIPPSGAEFLLIDQSDHPQPNPLRDWQQQEANRESTYPGYHRIRLESVRYPQAEKAADWEFTYYHQGVLTHVLNRNVLANAHHAYALYWSTPASEWAQSRHIFKVMAQTFRPAAP